MKKQLLSIATVLAAIAAFSTSFYQPTVDPPLYKVSLPVAEWNIVVTAINSPDDVTVNQKKAVLVKMVEQINAQISDTASKK